MTWVDRTSKLIVARALLQGHSSAKVLTELTFEAVLRLFVVILGCLHPSCRLQLRHYRLLVAVRRTLPHLNLLANFTGFGVPFYDLFMQVLSKPARSKRVVREERLLGSFSVYAVCVGVTLFVYSLSLTVEPGVLDSVT